MLNYINAGCHAAVTIAHPIRAMCELSNQIVATNIAPPLTDTHNDPHTDNTRYLEILAHNIGLTYFNLFIYR